MVQQLAGQKSSGPRSTIDQPVTAAGISLRVENVSKTFVSRGRVVEALQPIDLAISPGEFVCFLGPSGCGKSTLLSIIAGLERPDQGTIFVDERPVQGPGADRILLFQEAALFPWLDVQGNVEFGLRQQGVPSRERAAQARRYLALVHLKGFERSYIHQLSGGMRQRVAIARALAIDPAILLMDEPFTALDAFTRDSLYAELESIRAETHKTMLFVTHNIREAVTLGDRVVVFAPRPGRIICDFRISLPRLRSPEDQRLVGQSAAILEALREAMQDAAQELVNDRY